MILNPSKAIACLATMFPGLLSKKAVESMVIHDSISVESAQICFVQAEAREHEAGKNTSTEGWEPGKGILTDAFAGVDKDKLDDLAKSQFFANAKFQAMLASLKESDPFKHDEFVTLDNARNAAVSDIVSNYEYDFDQMLTTLTSADGADKDVINGLLQTKLRVEDIR